MRGSGSERITEFYGPGIVELSRLTTGKANKEIEEFASFLVAHGYDQQKVQLFFAPLSGGVDVIDHAQHAREFYAYVNSNGHLVNEGIVAWLIARTVDLPGSPRINGTAFVIHFTTVWIVTWLFVNGPMRVLFLRWRFRGGRII